MSNGHLAWLIPCLRPRQGGGDGPDGGHIKGAVGPVGPSRGLIRSRTRQETRPSRLLSDKAISLILFFLSDRVISNEIRARRTQIRDLEQPAPSQIPLPPLPLRPR